MKYPQSQFEKLLKVLPIVVNHYNITEKEQCQDIAHALHFKCFQQLNYTIDNANVIVKDGERLLPIDESFKLYPNNCNDDNIETAMKAAINKLFTN